MITRIGIGLSLASLGFLVCMLSKPADACCPAGPPGKQVVNADQTVIMIWDKARKTQHFIRQASFKSDADDFGFLVPSPTQPELDESGNEAFEVLRRLTAPDIKRVPSNRGDKKSLDKEAPKKEAVKVLEEKLVAGFHAAVLETKSTTALVQWLKENGYAFSPEVEAWAKPYVEAGWKITALKIAKDKASREKQSLTAAALRISFKTDRPIFPYREPDYKDSAKALEVNRRLLRIFFIAESRYQGKLTPDVPWTGKVAWSGKVGKEARKKVLEHLKLPQTTGPAEWWLTEFEDVWPYKVAPADVVFSRAPRPTDILKRDPIIQYVSE